MDVKYGKSIANLVENDVADFLKSKHAEVKVLSVPLPEENHVLGFGIGISKKNQVLHAQISQAIQELKNSGELP